VNNAETRRTSKSNGFVQYISVPSEGGMFSSDTQFDTEALANDMHRYPTVICIFHDLARD